jgi:hypothetical protein
MKMTNMGWKYIAKVSLYNMSIKENVNCIHKKGLFWILSTISYTDPVLLAGVCLACLPNPVDGFFHFFLIPHVHLNIATAKRT